MHTIPTIFVIDDNAMLRALITEQLQKTMPCEVVTFGCADNVLENKLLTSNNRLLEKL